MALFAPNTFNGLGRITAEGKAEGHLAFWLTMLGTEMSYRSLDADGDADAAANELDDGEAPDPDARPRLVIARTAGGTVAVALPAAADSERRTITVLRVGANNATIVPDGADTINGGGTVTLSADYDHRTLFCDGTEWFVLGSS